MKTSLRRVMLAVTDREHCKRPKLDYDYDDRRCRAADRAGFARL